MSTPSLASRVRAVLANANLNPDALVVLACSGGLDSQVLLDVMAHVAKGPSGKGGARLSAKALRLVACGVDHGLRPEAMVELALVRELAAARGVPFVLERIAVERGPNLQSRARQGRYEALRRVANEYGATHIATAHHLDDRAETVLMRIFRGAPLAGLAVLPEVAGDLLRPLIRAPRCELRAHALRRHLAWADDPSNVNPRYLRVRIRQEVLPLLRSIDPRIAEHLVTLADEAHDLPRDEQHEALRQIVTDLQGPAYSARALVALRRAQEAGREGDRVLLRQGHVARWDRHDGLVITGRDERSESIERPTLSNESSDERIASPAASTWKED